MIPASQASLRAWSAVIGSPVSNTAGAWLSPSRFSRVMVTTIGGVDAAGLREPVEGVAGDVLAERVPEPLGGAGVAAVLG